MKKEKKTIPNSILKITPLKFQFLEEVKMTPNPNNIYSRVMVNNYYNTSYLVCEHNYRNSSLLINHGGI
jgi:hypothetical protein